MNKVVSASFYVHQPVGKVGPQPVPDKASQLPPNDTFRAVLDRQVRQDGEVRFSAHAHERLATRDINLTSVEIGKINQAVDRVAAKGGRNTLVIGRDYSLIVNVPNRTVITAMPRGGLNSNVVTNIDSTVFVE